MVKNGVTNPVMVPAGSKEQWSTGSRSFLKNVANMPGVSVANCGPRLDAACFLWVSGIGGGIVNDKGRNIARIGDTSLTWTTSLGTGKGDGPAGSGLVGEGTYPDVYGSKSNPGPFYTAENGTFDTVAVGAGTTATFYKSKNFAGAVALTVTGPAVLVNERWSRGEKGGVSNYWKNDWLTENWANDPDPFVNQFTPATRSFIKNFWSAATGRNGGIRCMTSGKVVFASPVHDSIAALTSSTHRGLHRMCPAQLDDFSARPRCGRMKRPLFLVIIIVACAWVAKISSGTEERSKSAYDLVFKGKEPPKRSGSEYS